MDKKEVATKLDDIASELDEFFTDLDNQMIVDEAGEICEVKIISCEDVYEKSVYFINKLQVLADKIMDNNELWRLEINEK